MVDAMLTISEYIAGLDEKGFEDKPIVRDAVVRQLLILGEAAKHISDHIRSENPSIPWRRIAGMRDILIHYYHGTDWQTVWEVSQTEIPNLLPLLQDILHNPKHSK